MTIMDCKTCDISSFPIETIYNPFFVFLQALFFGGEEKLPAFLARHTIPGLGIVVDPCAAVLILIVTVLLCIGIKEVCSSYLNICNPFNLCLDNSFFVILFYYYYFFFTAFEKSLNISEYIGTNHCYNSKCQCIAFHHNSWWIFRFQNWMDWI